MTSPVRATDGVALDPRAAGRTADLASTTMMVGGAACVILGGLAAAVIGPLELGNGSWLAAYLVLVCGVGSCTIGAAQARSAPTSVRWAWAQLSCWTVGNLAVITGSLVGIPAVVDAGALLLVIVLLLALVHTASPSRSDHRTLVPAGRLIRWGYRCLLVLLMVSAPVGAVLAHLRSG